MNIQTAWKKENNFQRFCTCRYCSNCFAFEMKAECKDGVIINNFFACSIGPVMDNIPTVVGEYYRCDLFNPNIKRKDISCLEDLDIE